MRSCGLVRRSIRSRGRRFRVDRGVFDPLTHLSGIAFADHVHELVPDGARVLEVGVGCGVVAAALAERASGVVATDIDPVACSCAARNLADLAVSDAAAFAELAKVAKSQVA